MSILIQLQLAFNMWPIIFTKLLNHKPLVKHWLEIWKQAINSEYEPLLQNKTWDVVELPSGKKTISSKWVFSVKYGDDRKVEQFKAHLVAKGYAQEPGIDYDGKMSPVVKISVHLSIICTNDMLHVLHQMDVVTVFLNGTLEEGFTYSNQMDMINKERTILFASLRNPCMV